MKKLVAGQTVELLIDGKAWHKGKVRDALASQFTIVVNKVPRFFFYADKGITWRTNDE
jgi:hypothetical protein